MTPLVLVGIGDQGKKALAGLTVPAAFVDGPDLGEHLDDDVELVVVGERDPDRVVALVQAAHRGAPRAQVAVLVPDGAEQAVRAQVRFAADVPADLALVPVDAPDVAGRLAELRLAAARRRTHEQVLAGIRARESARPGSAGVVRTSLGAMLEQAPIGVVVADAERHVLACNRAASELLSLSGNVAGAALTELFVDPAHVARLVEAASTVGAADPWPEETIRARGGTHLDVSAALTRLEDGRDVVMLLIGDATARRHAEQARDALSDQVAMIGRVSEALVGTEDPEDALRRIAEQVVPTLADWVSMQLYDERNATRHVVARHSDPRLADLTALVQRRLPDVLSEESPSRRLARGEPPILLPRISDELLSRFIPDPGVLASLRDIGVDSAIAVPLEGRRTRVGAMVLINGAASLPLGEQELAVAVEVGRRVGIALETLHLYRRQRVIAEELQRSMLTDPPAPSHAEIAVRYLPAADEAQVGGDWYDAYLQSDGSIVLSIGDVVGHDYRAAAAMGQLRGLLRGIGYSRGGGPAEMLRSLDAAIEGLLPGTTATAVVARVTAGPGPEDPLMLLWSNAGHPPPLLVPHGCEPVVLAVEQTDLILGVVPDAARRETEAEILPGDTLLLYSDGLIERRDRDLDEGLEELRRALADGAHLPLEELCDHLIRRLVLDEHDDDVALVALRLRR